MPVVGGSSSAPGQANAGVCTPWATDADLCTPCDTAAYDWDQTLLEDCLQAASDVLFNLTGRQWAGACEDTIRPCGPDSCCSNHGRCGCSGVSVVTFPNFPVTEITEVLVDGAVVSASEYRVDDWKHLVGKRLADGSQRIWPRHQDLSKDTSELYTFEISYVYGANPPPGGVKAAAELGCELALSCQPETVGDCRLPQRITSVTRQGVTMAVLDTLEWVRQGATGLAMVDLFVASVNPGHIPRRASVSSPDTGWRGVRTTTP